MMLNLPQNEVIFHRMFITFETDITGTIHEVKAVDGSLWCDGMTLDTVVGGRVTTLKIVRMVRKSDGSCDVYCNQIGSKDER